MAQCKPAPLCNHLMPTGNLCRGVALRDQRYCRSHIRNYRQLERDRAQIAALDQLAEKVERMDLDGVLNELSCRLTQLSFRHHLTRFHEVSYLLAHSIDLIYGFRTGKLNAPVSNTKPQFTLDQSDEELQQLTLNEINEMIIRLGDSVT